MSCSTFVYSGIGKCDSMREKVVGVFMCDEGTSAADAKLLATWSAIIAPLATPTGIYIPLQRGFQNNTAEPEIVTSNTGYAEKVSDPAPQVVGFGKISYIDYKTFFSADDADKEFYLILNDGTIEGTKNSAGEFVGYWGSVNVRYNAPNADNIAEGYPFYINFQDVNEWKVNSTSVTPAFSVRDIAKAQPAGLSMEVITPWAVNVVTVKITKRGNPNEPYVYTAADAANFPIKDIGQNASPTIDSIDDANKALGLYELTTLGVTTSIKIQAIDDDATNTTYMSNVTDIDI